MAQLTDILSTYSSVGLEEIKDLELMRRVNAKYVLPVSRLPELLLALNKHYHTLEISGKRQMVYENLYFDTPDYSCYTHHHNKRGARFKVRMRCYKDSDTYFLELKQRNNKGQTIKNRQVIAGFRDLNSDHAKYLSSFIDWPQSGLHKKQENVFNRITLVSFESKERITIDTDIRAKVGNKKASWDHVAIVEVKKEKSNGSSPVSKQLKAMRIYPRSFSKYCIGVSALEPIKHNSFKSNLLFLEKLKKTLIHN